jgi:hypothetical protein
MKIQPQIILILNLQVTCHKVTKTAVNKQVIMPIVHHFTGLNHSIALYINQLFTITYFHA